MPAPEGNSGCFIHPTRRRSFGARSRERLSLATAAPKRRRVPCRLLRGAVLPGRDPLLNLESRGQIISGDRSRCPR